MGELRGFLYSPYWAGDRRPLVVYEVYIFIVKLLFILIVLASLTLQLIETGKSTEAKYIWTDAKGIPLEVYPIDKKVPAEKLRHFAKGVTIESFNFDSRNWRESLIRAQTRYYDLIWEQVSQDEFFMDDINSRLNVRAGTGAELIAAIYQTGLISLVQNSSTEISSEVKKSKVTANLLYEGQQQYLVEQEVSIRAVNLDLTPAQPRIFRAKITYKIIQVGNSRNPIDNLIVSRIQIERI